MKHWAIAIAALAVSGCSDKVSDMDCGAVAGEAIDISKGALLAINDRKQTSKTDQRIVCHGTGLFKSGKEIPVRFQAFYTDDQDIFYKYDTEEYHAALEKQAVQQEQREEDQAVQKFSQAYDQAMQNGPN